MTDNAASPITEDGATVQPTRDHVVESLQRTKAGKSGQWA